MIAVFLHTFPTTTEALDWLTAFAAGGVVVRVILTRGEDGLVRGSALVRR